MITFDALIEVIVFCVLTQHELAAHDQHVQIRLDHTGVKCDMTHSTHFYALLQ